MQCPRCQADLNVDSRCECGYRACLEAGRQRLTDVELLTAFREAGDDGRDWFTIPQAYAALIARRPAVGSSSCGCLGVAGILALVSLICFRSEGMAMTGGLLGAVSLLLLVAALRAWVNRPPSLDEFRDTLETWSRHNPPPEKLLLVPGLTPEDYPTPDQPGSLLLVERDILVDLLVRNGFADSQRTLVLAESGYPAHQLTVARSALEREPDIPVYFLHDSTEQGIGLGDRLEQGQLLPLRGGNLTALGLFPDDVILIPELLRHAPERQNFRLPVDYLSTQTLRAKLPEAMSRHCSLGQLWLEARAEETGVTPAR